jgi:hypothetical protein
MARLSGEAWSRLPGRGWSAIPLEDAARHDLDRQLVYEALQPEDRTVAEDRGTSFIAGARARHCRIPIEGTTLRLALPQVALLVGDTDLSRWRGELDFWVFADGELGQADGRLTGPAGGLDPDALNALIRFRLTAVDRGLPISVLPPAR